jgi:hypothetical protein
VSETFNFLDFLSAAKTFAEGGSRVPFGEILRRRLVSLGIKESTVFVAENGNGLCLARFLDRRRGIRAGLITEMYLHPDHMRIVMYDPTLGEVEVPYDALAWFSVEGKIADGKYAIRDGVLTKEELTVNAEGAASELEAPPTPSVA